MADGSFRRNTIRQLQVVRTGVVQRVRQRVIALGEYTPRYCIRPPAMAEVMPWDDDAPEITEVDAGA
jgi:hypothetical protein